MTDVGLFGEFKNISLAFLAISVGMAFKSGSEDQGLRVMASQGYTTELQAYEDEPMPLDLPALGRAVISGLPQQMDASRIHNGEVLLKKAQSQIVIPIRREAEVIGLLMLESGIEERYEQESEDFLSRLTDHAAIAISNAQLYSEVQRANIAKSDFVSFVSHELKTPMTSIKGYAELLSAGAVGEISEAQNEFLQTIRSNITRMATLVSDLADVSRIEAGRLHLDFSAESMKDIAEEVVRTTQAMIDEKHHELVMDVPDDLPSIFY